MRNYVCEILGTFTLVFIGCGAAALGGDILGQLGIGFAFGAAIIAMAYTIGPISGCHVNPAASIGMFVAGRMNAKDLIGYIISQCLGAFIAAAVLAMIAQGKISGYDITVNGLGQNGWGTGYLGGYKVIAAILFELVASFIFITVILESTRDEVRKQFAGFAIGITLAALVAFGFQITGTSVNPARSLGPALIVGGKALAQVWMFLIVPSLGGVLAGIFSRSLKR